MPKLASKPEQRRATINLRIRPSVRNGVLEAASLNGRSMAGEIEARIEASFREGPTLEDVRAIIRDELRAVLREERGLAAITSTSVTSPLNYDALKRALAIGSGTLQDS